jgi:hypothetical protein
MHCRHEGRAVSGYQILGGVPDVPLRGFRFGIILGGLEPGSISEI